MIKLVKIVPLVGRVACLAAVGSRVRSDALHARAELPLVRIGVARSTRKIAEVIRHRLGFRCRLVAVRTSDSEVSASQNKTTLLVFRKRKRRRVERFLGMTLLALVEVRRRGKLRLVRILVAIRAERELYFEHRRLARRNVALRAIYGRVFAAQWKSRARVIGSSKLRLLPSVDSVAALALAAVGALGKLPVVRVGLMAVCAESVGDGRFEVTALVAGIAC